MALVPILSLKVVQMRILYNIMHLLMWIIILVKISLFLGCTDVLAFNYDPSANTDNGLCEQVEIGCMDENYLEFNPINNTEDSSMCLTEVVLVVMMKMHLIIILNQIQMMNLAFIIMLRITFEMFANGIVEFTSDVFGMGSDYIILWDFGDGSYSNDNNPTYTYSDNGLMEVVLSVTTGEDVLLKIFKLRLLIQ